MLPFWLCDSVSHSLCLQRRWVFALTKTVQAKLCKRPAQFHRFQLLLWGRDTSSLPAVSALGSCWTRGKLRTVDLPWRCRARKLFTVFCKCRFLLQNSHAGNVYHAPFGMDGFSQGVCLRLTTLNANEKQLFKLVSLRIAHSRQMFLWCRQTSRAYFSSDLCLFCYCCSGLQAVTLLLPFIMKQTRSTAGI